eukprot:CAMPEP_0185576618 /NCGR_PEP_ID=MMETSP0434-20130131/7506_1 /TAXON_ID=626734 ORGANISM="Favella taraikaensis, Strain Fe Narragansett Bay" /NCGR_SAMPLE_ID=MMETSP0434 /ASSEMBLY_ACC=CAM_ASM_000379 /LENGTH=63 /DNA_ID=CAMNT_0028193891 /DNA_START=506 /DNA_END=693 /DNA_ORIENTATION=+
MKHKQGEPDAIIFSRCMSFVLNAEYAYDSKKSQMPTIFCFDLVGFPVVIAAIEDVCEIRVESP